MRNTFCKTLLIITSVLLFSLGVKAQFLDTLKYSIRQTPKPYGSLDFSRALGKNNGTDVIGYRLGIVQNKRLYSGLGYYRFNTDKVYDITVQTKNETDTVVPSQLKLRFLTLNAEYVFYRDNKFQMSVPVNLGYGNSFYQYFISEGEKQKTTRSGSAIATIGINANYKIVPWFGFGVGMGYATTMGSNKISEQNFKSITYSFGLNIYFAELYAALLDFRDHLNDKKKEVEEGPQPDFK